MTLRRPPWIGILQPTTASTLSGSGGTAVIATLIFKISANFQFESQIYTSASQCLTTLCERPKTASYSAFLRCVSLAPRHLAQAAGHRHLLTQCESTRTISTQRFAVCYSACGAHAHVRDLYVCVLGAFFSASPYTGCCSLIPSTTISSTSTLILSGLARWTCHVRAGGGSGG